MRHLWLGDATTSRPSELSVAHIIMMGVMNGIRSEDVMRWGDFAGGALKLISGS